MVVNTLSRILDHLNRGYLGGKWVVDPNDEAKFVSAMDTILKTIYDSMRDSRYGDPNFRDTSMIPAFQPASDISAMNNPLRTANKYIRFEQLDAYIKELEELLARVSKFGQPCRMIEGVLHSLRQFPRPRPEEIDTTQQFPLFQIPTF